MEHASNALDDVRRQEFFRAGAVIRQPGRGKRWLLWRLHDRSDRRVM
jgi:hypothetical protein